ncbi:hypothetical protein [Streptomyces sp. NPDC088755]|uniref:hypothetical protein n=1 Tax=Streptomyces sp. NPDC088755 TaxID=3365888 RepID=UPI0038185DDF
MGRPAGGPAHLRHTNDFAAAKLYAEAARQAPDLAGRDHLTRWAACLNSRAE